MKVKFAMNQLNRFSKPVCAFTNRTESKSPNEQNSASIETIDSKRKRPVRKVLAS